MQEKECNIPSYGKEPKKMTGNVVFDDTETQPRLEASPTTVLPATGNLKKDVRVSQSLSLVEIINQRHNTNL